MNKREKKVHEKVILLGEFCKEFGRKPKAKEEYKGVKIGNFWYNVRSKSTKINEEDISYLEALGVKLNYNNDQELLHEKVLILGNFYEEFSREPKLKEEYKGVKIGRILENIRIGITSIDKEDKKYLQNLGIRLTKGVMKERTHEKVLILGRFYGEFGREPKVKEEYEGVRIGRFLVTVRVGITSITEEDRKYLQKLGIRLTKGRMQERVHEKVITLGKFYNEFGRDPKAQEEYDGVKIGFFFYNIKRGLVSITTEDRNYLESLGVQLFFKNRQEKVHEKVILLGKFCSEFGRKPKVREEYEGANIGLFLSNVQKNKTSITKEDRAYLESLGIPLFSKNRQEQVHEKVMLLGKFYNEFDRDPKAKEEYEGVRLGIFLSSVRSGKTEITIEDRYYLENLGIRLFFNNRREQVHEKVMMLGRFYCEFARAPKVKEEYEGIRLGAFFNSVKTGKTSITTEDRNYLKSLGIKL